MNEEFKTVFSLMSDELQGIWETGVFEDCEGDYELYGEKFADRETYIDTLLTKASGLLAASEVLD